MTDTKRIPGPWFQLSGGVGTVNIANSVGPHWSRNDHYVGQVTTQNARLVAAAPELLEALKAFETVISDDNRTVIDTLKAVMAARSAIDKATS